MCPLLISSLQNFCLRDAYFPKDGITSCKVRKWSGKNRKLDLVTFCGNPVKTTDLGGIPNLQNYAAQSGGLI